MMKTALIVDDSPTMRTIIKSILTEMDFQCFTAQDGEKALKMAGNKVFDIIITDINMPNMNGLEMIEAFREIKSSAYTPILIVSTESNDDLKNQARKLNASGWIVKPFVQSTLVNAVSKLVS